MADKAGAMSATVASLTKEVLQALADQDRTTLFQILAKVAAAAERVLAD